MKQLTMLSFLFAISFTTAFAQYSQPVLKTLDLRAICQGKHSDYAISYKKVKLQEKDLITLDGGFCAEYLKQQYEIQVDPTVQAEADRWKIRLYMSHSFTTYFNSNVAFKSTRYNVTIKDYEWAERSSREFFTPEEWKKPESNMFQMIDEPSNTFTASIEKDGHEFFIQAFHPKFFQAPDQVKYMQGTIDGTWVDGFAPVNKPFDGYDQTPGESELVRNENTHRQMTFEVGYGHRFNLVKGKYGSISYIPSLAVGVMVGNNYSVMIKENEWWEFDGYQDAYGIQGFGGSFTNRIEFNTPKERFGLFYENKFSFYHQHHGFLDGTQKYNLGYMGNSVGMKFMIYNPKNHKKK